MLLLAGLIVQLCASQSANSLTVYVDTSTVIHETSDKFVSAAIDQMLLNNTPQFNTWDFNSPRLLTLLKGFAPMYLRFGGTPADWSVYSDASTNFTKQLNTTPALLTMSSRQWELMLMLTRKAGVRYLHDFNLQLRYGTQWDPSNTINLLQHITSKGLGDNLDFELGNEPGTYNPSGGRLALSGTQIGKDYLMLKKVMSHYPVLKQSILVGPESVMIGEQLIREFVNTAGPAITAVTIHHYYFYGPTATVKDFINPKYFSNLNETLTKAYSIVRNSSYPNTPIWIGETSNCWGSGAPNITDRYVDGFLWLEKLGLSAQMGIGVVVRQTFYGYSYNLISNDLRPNPTYWLCYIFKQLVGTKVLRIERSKNPLVRVYAHCTNTRSGRYKAGAVTVFALSVSQNETTTVSFPQYLGQGIDMYLLTPGDQDALLSRYVSLNGRPLMMVDDYTMPSISPYRTQLGAGIKIPPLTFGYWVFPDAAAKACL